MRSQSEKVLRHLQTRGGISTFDAFVQYGITRLSGRIFDLRQAGWQIGNIHKKTPEGKRYDVYYLMSRERATE